MNTLNNVITFLSDWAQSNIWVGTVEFAKSGEMDLNRKNIYPLFVINPVSSPKTSNVINYYTFEIGVFDQRDVSNQIKTDKVNGNDDLIDNLNITDAIIDQLLDYLRNSYNEYQIELFQNSDALPSQMRGHNTLDGYIINITLAIPRKRNCE